MAGEWVGYTTLSPLTSRLVAPSCWWFSWARAAARGFERKKRRENPSKTILHPLRDLPSRRAAKPPSPDRSRKGEGVPVAQRRSVGVCFGSRESTTYKHPPSSGPASHFLLPLKEKRKIRRGLLSNEASWYVLSFSREEILSMGMRNGAFLKAGATMGPELSLLREGEPFLHKPPPPPPCQPLSSSPESVLGTGRSYNALPRSMRG